MKSHFCRFLPGVLLLVLSAAHAASSPSHYTPEGFQNNYSHERYDFGNAVELVIKYSRIALTPVEFDLAENDPDYLRANGEDPTLTWIGHASFLIQMGGKNILTDPHMTERATPLFFGPPSRLVPPGLEFEDLPHIDAVVISHNHYDHLDDLTVRRLAVQPGGAPLFLVPIGLKAWFAERGIRHVVELDWWERVAAKDLVFNFVPAQHYSSRSPSDYNKTLWGGWVIEAPDMTFYFAGDTGYSKDFADIGARFRSIDLAAIPIGAYAPRALEGVMHVTPEEAVQIHKDVGARFSVGMHWGTFRLTEENPAEPPERLAAARKAAGVTPAEFFVLRHGETRELKGLIK